jgi:outer membrane protein assembly factor BamA
VRWFALPLLLWSALAAAEGDDPAWPRVIGGLQTEHLSWTRVETLERELPWKKGESVTKEQWELGLTRLWNTDLFSRIDARVETRDGKDVAIFDVEERFSLNPLFSFGVGGGAWWFRVGANDVNWLGRYLEWGVRYERFDVYNGGQGWLRDPRLFDKRLSGLLQVEYLVRPRPDYARRRMAGILEVQGEVDDLTRLGVRLDVFHDEYLAPRVGAAVLPENLWAAQLTFSVKVGRVDTIRLRQTGWSLELKQVAGGASPALPYLQTLLELLWFKPLGERWNLAVRGQGALSSAVPTELGFYVGGLDLVRGYADSLVRTQAYALVNAEARVTLFDSMWFAIVGAGFVDAAITGPDLRPLVSAGAGVRLLVPRLVRTGIRVDGAVTLIGRPEFGLSLGVFQFF